MKIRAVLAGEVDPTEDDELLQLLAADDDDGARLRRLRVALAEVEHHRALGRAVEHLGQAGEVGMDRRENVFAPTGGAQAGDGFGLFDGIDIQADESAARDKTRQQFPRVSAEAERAIHHEFAGVEREHLKNLGHHDRPVGARRRLARGEHLGHVGGVMLRIELLVFLLEAPRILAAIARTAPVGRRRWRRCVSILHTWASMIG